VQESRVRSSWVRLVYTTLAEVPLLCNDAEDQLYMSLLSFHNILAL
jgi:hypothetical protein